MKIDRWTSGADYDQWMGRWSRLLALEFLKWLNLPSGLRWLDVCCGSGIVTEAIAEGYAPASVVGVDLSPEQIDFARQHRARRPNVTFETGDAIALPFADSSFDVAVCGLGLNYIPNPARALEDLRAVRPGGTIAVYVWDYAEGARFLREFWDAATAIDAGAASFDQARRFQICAREGLRSLFGQARLHDVTLCALEIVTHFASFDDYWAPLLAGQGSAPNYLATRDEKIQSAIRERLRAALPTNAQGAIDLPARAWAVRARRP